MAQLISYALRVVMQISRSYMEIGVKLYDDDANSACGPNFSVTWHVYEHRAI